jgi:hypothetical protein
LFEVLEPERPERMPRAPGVPAGEPATIVRQYRPATADLWRLSAGRSPELLGAERSPELLGGERSPELRLQPELVGDLLEIPDVL